MGNRGEGVNAELVQDEAYRFIMRVAGNVSCPVYTYPTNGLPTLKQPSTKIETSFLVAMRQNS